MKLDQISPPDDLIAALKIRYSEPDRAYHTWEHIEALLRHFERFAQAWNNSRAVLWALYWHDAIYDVQGKDNEARSADLLRVDAASLLSKSDLELAVAIIDATTKHLVPDGLSADDQADLELFLDLDLSILATEPHVFDAYETAIAKEYSWVPTDAYKIGRAAVLKGFLSREALYFSDVCRKAWEAQARDNLVRSIAALSH